MNFRIISCVGIALIIFFIYPSPTTKAQMFEPKVDYHVGEHPSGDYPRDVAIADLNGDGHPDMAVVNSVVDTVSVLLGNGDGTFQDAVDYGVGDTGDHPLSLAVDDLNGDGVQDMVTGNDQSENVSVFLGNGDGTFQPCVNYWVGDAIDTVTGDLDGDGDTDIAVCTWYSGSVMVLLGNGDGTYQLGAGQVLDALCSSMAIGDFDQDGIPDLAVTSHTWHYNEDRVSVLLGDGDATFHTVANYVIGDYGTLPVVAIADMNNDSIPDLTTVYEGDTTVRVMLGNGDGTFQEAIANEDIGYPTSLAIGDLDGDGNQDLAMPNFNMYPGYYSTVVLLGNGDGTFWPPLYFDTTGQMSSAAIGDLDSDGSLDLAVSDVHINSISVLLNRGKPVTLFTDFSCAPPHGNVPFDTRMSVTLLNRIPNQPRRVAAQIQVDLADGQSLANWRAGYQNIAGGGNTTTTWHQTIPALGSLIGLNQFTLVVEDVTPAPWNQPPYLASGYSAANSCTIFARIPEE